MKKRRGISALQRRMMEQGKISPRAWRKQMADRGLLSSNAINENGNRRPWPPGSKVKSSNNRASRRGPKENFESFGGWYSGRSGRP
jgi:hypothetical protein